MRVGIIHDLSGVFKMKYQRPHRPHILSRSSKRPMRSMGPDIRCIGTGFNGIFAAVISFAPLEGATEKMRILQGMIVPMKGAALGP